MNIVVVVIVVVIIIFIIIFCVTLWSVVAVQAKGHLPIIKPHFVQWGLLPRQGYHMGLVGGVASSSSERRGRVPEGKAREDWILERKKSL